MSGLRILRIRFEGSISGIGNVEGGGDLVGQVPGLQLFEGFNWVSFC